MRIAETNQSRRERRSGRAGEPLRVLVIRHAMAEEKGKFAKTGAPDAERPLTRIGKRKMRKGARGIVRLEPELSTLASSPLTRAAQTADLLAREYARSGVKIEPVRLSVLAPGKTVNLLLTWVAEQKRGTTIAVVGHEPHLGQFISWALTGLRDSFLELKKGSACLLEFAGEVRPGHAKLLWSMRLGELRSV